MGDGFKRLTTRLWRGGALFMVWLLLLPASVLAQGASHRAGLVIRFGDGSVITRCVSFSEPRITGLELLWRAGLSLRVDTSSSIGAGVCKINHQGCDVGKSCFCQCEGSTCAYWQYFHLQDGSWKYSNLGASAYQIADGAVEGWSWGDKIAPPVMTLDQICAAGLGVPTARPGAPALASPFPTLTATPLPVTSTPRLQGNLPTATPTAFPSATRSLTGLPTLPPASPTWTPTLSSPMPDADRSSSVATYAVFGMLVLSLGVWLVIQARRRSKP